MAQIIINIPDAQLTRTLNGLGEFYNYSPTLTQSDGSSIPNPESRAAFIKRMITSSIKDAVLKGEAQLAYEAAQAAAPPDITVP